MENTTNTFKVIIESGPEGVTYSLETNCPVFTRDLVGVFEMCKLMAFEKKIPQEEVKQVKVCNGTNSIIEATREVRIREEEHLSVRARNGLLSNGVETLEDLLRCSDKFIKCFRNIGHHTLYEIEQYVIDKGFSLGCLAALWRPSGCCQAYLTNNNSRGSIWFNDQKERDEFVSRQNKIIKQKELGLL